jgi:hypothetical protein
MSRSYKKQPFMAICGNGSAKQDKIQAHKGERRAHKRTIHKALTEQDYDILLPHRLECSWNNIYSWGRDGNQRWCIPSHTEYQWHLEALYEPNSIWYGDESYSQWPPSWYVEMMRK